MNNILIVKLSAIGDVIHTLPALNLIRKHYPQAHITWLIEEAAYPLIEGHKALDRVIISKRKRWIKLLSGKNIPFFQRKESLKQAYEFIKTLRDTHYDMVLDFQALLKSGVLIALTRGNRKIGFDKGMEHMEHSYVFLNERIPPVSMEYHAIVRNMMFLKALRIPSDEIAYHLPIQKSDQDKINEMLFRHGIKGEKPLVAVNPVAKWETKLWDNEKFAHLADNIIEGYSADIVFTGAPEDVNTIEMILSHMKHKAVSLAGKTTLKTLAALYQKSDLLISTDTGPMHLGAAVGIPVVALFGPTAPWRTGPFGEHHQVIRAELSCSPCFKRTCSTMDCMKQISVAQVMDGVDKLLSVK